MKLPLDENFPIQLYRRLRESGEEVEHLIVSGQRGLPDAAITALVPFLADPPPGSLFELLPTGRIVLVERRRNEGAG